MRLLNSSSKIRLYKLLTRSMLVLLVGLLYYFFISFTDLKIPCLFFSLTGLYCPGCGITRMAIALLHFDFLTAFYYQPVILCSSLPLGLCFGAMALQYVKIGKTTLSRWQNIILWLTIVSLIVFCFYRNLKMIL